MSSIFAYVFCFSLGSALGLLASEFADRWGCSQRHHSSLPKKVFIFFMCGVGAALLYCWEVEHLMLIFPNPVENLEYNAKPLFYLHLTLFTFLLAATLTDFYEMIIPDSITVVGTTTALWFAFFLPMSGLPMIASGYSICCDPTSDLIYEVITLATWNQWIQPYYGQFFPMIAMTLLWWFWCFAMLDRVWYTKLPFRKANAIFWRYLYRSPRTKYFCIAAVVIPLCFVLFSETSHVSLFSALTGMATGMILIWGIRLVAQWVLGIEAMGFGDVTLMGMIGAFLGWQAVLLIFFIAPFFGLVYGIINVALGKGRAVPYGPFLCLASVVVVIAWRPIWSLTAEYFSLGIGVIGLGLLVLLVLFGGLLHVVHQLFSRLR
jgi:prepilin signal peptidase PulO-like enzyme (type II secretory pathway)